MAKRTTIYDVAKHAGVSHQTVSRFMAGFPGIRPDTRARVAAAVDALDYRPNSAARALKHQRTAVVPDEAETDGAVAQSSATARQPELELRIVLKLSVPCSVPAAAVPVGRAVVEIPAADQAEILHILSRTPGFENLAVFFTAGGLLGRDASKDRSNVNG